MFLIGTMKKKGRREAVCNVEAVLLKLLPMPGLSYCLAMEEIAK
jgi:hypothetical protein